MGDQLDPDKFHVLDKRKKAVLGVLCGIALVALIPLSLAYYRTAVRRPASNPEEINLEIKTGWSVSRIADELYRAGALNSKALFLLYLGVNSLSTNIQAGVYNIPPEVSLEQLAKILLHGTNDIAVTFLEGWRVEQFALEVSVGLPNVSYSEFVQKTRPLEGYLFPDTYFFNRDVTTEAVIKKLQETFEAKTHTLLTKENLQNAGLTREETVIFASIVEREVADLEDGPLVAGILIKRYKNNEFIGADATVQYYAPFLRADCSPDEWITCILDYAEANETSWWPYMLTRADLDYDSPYNTRKNLGLPPAPISSISLSSLEAVLNYKETVFNYYINDAAGKTYFAEDLEGHQRNINLYLHP